MLLFIEAHRVIDIIIHKIFYNNSAREILICAKYFTVYICFILIKVLTWIVWETLHFSFNFSLYFAVTLNTLSCCIPFSFPRIHYDKYVICVMCDLCVCVCSKIITIFRQKQRKMIDCRRPRAPRSDSQSARIRDFDDQLSIAYVFAKMTMYVRERLK